MVRGDVHERGRRLDREPAPERVLGGIGGARRTALFAAYKPQMLPRRAHPVRPSACPAMSLMDDAEDYADASRGQCSNVVHLVNMLSPVGQFRSNVRKQRPMLK